MNIEFQKIKMWNFMSVGNMPIEIQFTRNDVTMISGSNGTCKSGVLSDSITYVLYGCAYRDVKKSQLINSINGRGTLVEVDFRIRGKQYQVRRGMKPEIFEIYEDGKMLEQDAARRDYQQILEDNILGMNLKSFKQIVILSVADYVPFMSLRSRDRREIVEELLDIQIFSVMNEILSERKTSLKDTKQKLNSHLTTVTAELRSHESKLNSLRERDESIVSSNLEKISETETQISERMNKISDLNDILVTLNDSMPNIAELQERKSKITSIITKTETAKQRLERDITFFRTHNECPVCSQSISEDLRSRMIETKTERCKDVLNVESSVNSQFNELKEVIRKASEISGKIKNITGEISTMNGLIRSNRMYIDQLKSHNSEISSRSVEEEEREKIALEKMNSQKRKLEEKISHVAVKEDDHQVCTKLLKDDGIKTQIIEKYIPTINRILNHYLENFDFAVSFNFDSNFNEVIRSRYRDEFSYSSFSKGERARIDFAITLAFREIAKLKNSTATNILIIDELFENMDYFGVNKALDMLSSLKETHSFIVSHKQEIIDSSPNRIQLVKNDGFTMMN